MIVWLKVVCCLCGRRERSPVECECVGRHGARRALSRQAGGQNQWLQGRHSLLARSYTTGTGNAPSHCKYTTFNLLTSSLIVCLLNKLFIYKGNKMVKLGFRIKDALRTKSNYRAVSFSQRHYPRNTFNISLSQQISQEWTFILHYS